MTSDGEEEADLPETVTLLVTPNQASILAELEAEGEIHISLVYRGTADNAQKFIAAQEKLLTELAEAEKVEKEKSEKAEDVTVPAEPTEPTDTEDTISEDVPVEGEEENSPVIDTVIINTPEETETTESTEAVETEVTTDGESV